MTIAERQEVEQFASEIIRRYFCDGDVEFLIAAFASDIVWTGGGRAQKAEGVEATSQWVRDAADSLIPCRMWDEEYVTTEPAPGMYLCCGRSELESVVPGMPIRIQQRTTFLFRRISTGLEVVHFHNSVPFEDIQQNELFPVGSAREVFKSMRDALGRKDRQIALMLSQLPGGMMICRPDAGFTIKWMSESLCHLLGYENYSQLSQAVGGMFAPFIHPDDITRSRDQLAGSLGEGDVSNLEYRVVRRDGSFLWVMEACKIFTDSDGKTAICCFVTDISERVARQRELDRINQNMTRQADFLTQLYDTVPCGIVQVGFTPDAKVVFVNKKALEIYGIIDLTASQDELHDRVLREPLCEIQPTIARLHREGGRATYQRELQRADGSIIWISSLMEAITNAYGTRVIQIILSDITETRLLQIEHEQERLIEKRSLHTAVCSVYQLILRVNLSRNVYVDVSGGKDIPCIKSRGTVDNLVQETLQAILPAHRADFWNAFNPPLIKERFEKGEKEVYVEAQRMGLDGQYHWVSMHCIQLEPVADDTDVLAILLVKLLDDQRAEKARQEQLLRDALAEAQAANLAKSDFLSRMSHDIRTPMNAIIGMSAIGQLKLNDTHRVLDCFKKIDTSCRYLLSLINDILDMSCIESGKMVLSFNKFDFVDLIRQLDIILHPQARAAGIEYDVYPQEPLARWYVGDALRINQILMNLLANSCKFTPRGGKVSLHIREIRRNSDVAHMEIIVRDTGLGMSSTFLRRIFDPFEQEHADSARNNVGSGLGLSIVYNLVQLMGGAIAVQSEQGQGTVFTVELPFGLTDCSEDAEKQRQATEILSGHRALVVDDDAGTGAQTVSIVQSLGASAVWVESGSRAIGVMQAALESGKCFDMILVDWKMPDMDGIETTRRLRRLLGSRAATISLMAYDWSAIEAEACAAGVDFFITKPLFQASFCDAILELHAQRGTEPQSEVVSESCAGKRVLLVEDNEINMEIARSILELRGMIVDCAENGQVAVDMFHQAGPNHYRAILMDIRMPVMDGLEATRAIRALPQSDAATVPIIAMSANAFDEDKAVAAQAGMSDYVVKPIDIGALFSTLHAWL